MSTSTSGAAGMVPTAVLTGRAIGATTGRAVTPAIVRFGIAIWGLHRSGRLLDTPPLPSGKFTHEYTLRRGHAPLTSSHPGTNHRGRFRAVLSPGLCAREHG